MKTEDKLLTADKFLDEMVILYLNRPQFAKLINGYFTPDKMNRIAGDRADRILTTLQSHQYTT